MHRTLRISALVAAAVTLTATAGPALAAPGHANGKTPCFGKAPTKFSAKNGAHLTGTGKADVLEATGKNVVVNGGGGNDRICIVSGTANGGAGQDSIKVLPGSGAVKIDGGAGPNTISVPSSRLAKATITPRSGDVVNGAYARVDAPATGGPAFDIGYDGNVGPTSLYSEGRPYANVTPNYGGNLDFYRPLAANGRTLAHWMVSWGDGSPNQGGNGGPPNYLRHLYLMPGSHTVVATLTDSVGASTVRTQAVNVAFEAADPTIAITGGNVATAATKSYTTTYTAGTGAQPLRWFVDFGDGTGGSGPGAPPASFSHTYTTPGSYYTYVTVVDDHGDEESNAVYSAYLPAAGPYTGFALSDRSVEVRVPGTTVGEDVSVPIAPGGAVPANEEVYLGNYSDNASVRSIDWGDGSKGDTYPYHYYVSGSGPITRTVTVQYVDNTGAPLPPVTHTLTVTPQTWQANLTPPALVLPEGKVTFKTAGTVLPPAGTYYWQMYWGDGSAPVVGFGSVPATFTHTYASGAQYPELEIYPDAGDSAYSEPYLRVTSTVPRITYFGGNENGDWIGALVGPDAAAGSAVYFSGGLEPSLGAHGTTGSLAFGDNTAPQALALGSGYFNGTPNHEHGYTTTGEFVATFIGKDSHGKSTKAFNHVSVGGLPTVNSPATESLGAHTSPAALNLSGVSAGANAQMLMYDIDWGDAVTPTNPDTIAYGSPSAAPTHLYATAGTYTVQITVYNDHGGSASSITKITVT
ncbi:MAG TPA: PKD domain-containing protein [Mycobacteriales bacterium]|nr:PKD domain-containing protein [Mycobacteriales bacterium]